MTKTKYIFFIALILLVVGIIGSFITYNVNKPNIVLEERKLTD